MGQNVSFPNLEVVALWSFVGGIAVTALAQDNTQKFVLGAILGFLADAKGYESEKFTAPDWALPAGAFVTGLSAIYPLPVILSIVVGGLAVPTYLVIKSISSSSQETDPN